MLYLSTMRTSTRLLAALLLAACSNPAEEAEVDPDSPAFHGPVAGKADGFSPVVGPLKFDKACVEGDSVTIAAVGDVLLHTRLQKQAFTQEDRFRSLWRGVDDLLSAADITYANLEGPAAEGVDNRGRDVTDPGEVFDNRVYTSYPMFNYHPSLVADLEATGVDVVSTANNHSLDRHSLGVTRTIDALEANQLPFTGTRRYEGERAWHTYTKANGINIAWIACTYATNGIRDTKNQVLFCYEDQDELEASVTALVADPSVDAVIVTPHWGIEYEDTPRTREVDLAHRLIDLGATAIIGSHPHVLQPWERYVTADGREGFVIYSLGNFVSNQSQLPRASTLILYLGLTKDARGEVHVNGARFVPVYVSHDRESVRAEAIDRIGGHTDSRALTLGMFNGFNLLPPGAALVTNAHCDPAWTPPPTPHPHDGWIGGACETDDACGGMMCLDNLPGGLCSRFCDRVCPDKSGRVPTFCADLGFSNGGVCLNRCTIDADCRDGYSCVETARNNEPSTIKKVCAPNR